MSIFTNPAADFSTTRFILPSDEYPLKIVKVAAKKIEKNDGSTAGIITFFFRPASGEFENRALQPYDCWYDDDGKNNRAMYVIMAALGIKPGTEAADEEFRQKFGHLDFGFDQESLEPNAGWNEVVNAVIMSSVSSKINTKTEQKEQTYSKFRPLGM